MTYGNPYVRDTANPMVELFAGDFPVESKAIVLASGQTPEMGWIMGQVTATGEFKLCVKAAVDGSEVPVGILVDDYDASLAPCDAELYLTGSFNRTHLAHGAGWTWPELEALLRPLSIFVKSVTPQ